MAIRHRLQWFIRLRAHSPRKGDEHPAYTPRGLWYTLLYPSLLDVYLLHKRVQQEHGRVAVDDHVELVDAEAVDKLAHALPQDGDRRPHDRHQHYIVLDAVCTIHTRHRGYHRQSHRDASRGPASAARLGP